jgi:hypothetical protein
MPREVREENLQIVWSHHYGRTALALRAALA